jgi:hypothetical protein
MRKKNSSYITYFKYITITTFYNKRNISNNKNETKQKYIKSTTMNKRSFKYIIVVY